MTFLSISQDKMAKSPASRVTLHNFIDVSRLGIALNTFAPNNSDARLSQDTIHWPPAVILDRVYAAAGIRERGSKVFSDYGWIRSPDDYYANFRMMLQRKTMILCWGRNWIILAYLKLPIIAPLDVLDTICSALAPKHQLTIAQAS